VLDRIAALFDPAPVGIDAIAGQWSTSNADHINA